MLTRHPARYRLTTIAVVEDTMGLGVDQLRQRAYDAALLLPARLADRARNPVVVAVRLLPAFAAMSPPAKREHLLAHDLLDLVTAAGGFQTHTDAALAGYHRGGHGPGADHAHDDEPEQRVRVFDARTGEPHDGVLRTRTGRVVTEEELDRWAAEAAEGEAEIVIGVDGDAELPLFAAFEDMTGAQQAEHFDHEHGLAGLLAGLLPDAPRRVHHIAHTPTGDPPPVPHAHRPAQTAPAAAAGAGP